MTAELPYPSFRYLLEYHGQFAAFNDVTLGQEDLSQVRPERLSTAELNLTLRTGRIQFGNELYKWLCSVKPITIERRDITLTLCDEAHRGTMAWKVISAFPVKVRGLQLKTTGNDVTIELIEIEHHGIQPAQAG